MLRNAPQNAPLNRSFGVSGQPAHHDRPYDFSGQNAAQDLLNFNGLHNGSDSSNPYRHKSKWIRQQPSEGMTVPNLSNSQELLNPRLFSTDSAIEINNLPSIESEKQEMLIPKSLGPSEDVRKGPSSYVSNRGRPISSDSINDIRMLPDFSQISLCNKPTSNVQTAKPCAPQVKSGNENVFYTEAEWLRQQRAAQDQMQQLAKQQQHWAQQTHQYASHQHQHNMQMLQNYQLTAPRDNVRHPGVPHKAPEMNAYSVVDQAGAITDMYAFQRSDSHRMPHEAPQQMPHHELLHRTFSIQPGQVMQVSVIPGTASEPPAVVITQFSTGAEFEINAPFKQSHGRSMHMRY